MTTNVTTGESVSFFEQYFIEPIIQRSGYNPISTITYGLLLMVSAYLIFKYFKRLGYKVDFEFFKASLPFVLLVAVWRSLTDAGVYPYGYFTTTPGLYVPVLLLFFPLVALAKWMENTKGWKYQYIYTGISTVLLITQLIIFISLTPGQFNPEAAWKVIYFTVLSSTPFLILHVMANTSRNKGPVIKFFKKKMKWLSNMMKDKLNTLMFIGHMFDASATHVSLEFYNYFEQHVVPRMVFELAGTSASFYAWKTIVLIGVIYLLDKEDDNKELTNYIKMIFIIYGLAIGLRNGLRLTLGV